MLTHRTVQANLAQYMWNRGWKRENPNRNHPLPTGGLSDEVFISEKGQQLYVEVKPETINISELWMGIGETVRTLVIPNSITALVCPEKYGKIAMAVFNELRLEKIGLLIYNSEGSFTPVLGTWEVYGITWLVESRQREKEAHQEEIRERKRQLTSIIEEQELVYGITLLECLKYSHQWVAEQPTTLNQVKRDGQLKRICPMCATTRIKISERNEV